MIPLSKVTIRNIKEVLIKETLKKYSVLLIWFSLYWFFLSFSISFCFDKKELQYLGGINNKKKSYSLSDCTSHCGSVQLAAARLWSCSSFLPILGSAEKMQCLSRVCPYFMRKQGWESTSWTMQFTLNFHPNAKTHHPAKTSLVQNQRRKAGKSHNYRKESRFL